MCLKRRRREYQTEVAAAPTYCPEKIRIPLGVCSDKVPVGENDVHSEEVINGKGRYCRVR